MTQRARFALAHPFGQPVTQAVVDDLAPARVTLSADDAHHLRSVLRLKVGDSFVATDGAGAVARLEAESVERSAIVGRVVARAQVAPPDIRLWLVADAEGARGDWLVEKAVELGAHAFVPVSGTMPGRAGRWRRLARAALKQSLSAHALQLPDGEALALATEAARRAGEAGVGFGAWLGHPDGADPMLQPLISQGDLFVVCGGASGFPQAGLDAWSALPGAVRVGLGPLRLRAETAALSLLSLARLRVVSSMTGRDTA